VLTDAGRAALVAAAPGHVQTVRRYVVDRLSAADLQHLGRISQRLLDGAADDPLD
jgi:hypothetical protein